MKTKILIIVIFNCLLLTATADCFSQTLSPKATPACSGYFSAGGKSLSWTMGETFNTTLTGGTKMLTQGEQQSYAFLKLINLKVFIEGYYAGNGQMQPLLFTAGVSADPTACDTITVELHSPVTPYALFTSTKAVVHTNGTADVRFPITVANNSYYIAIIHHNAIETWSKVPVKFNDAVANFDFTTP